MRHHFTDSEKLAIEAWFWLGKRKLIPQSIGQGRLCFDDMLSSMHYEGLWSPEDELGTSERVVCKIITFCFEEVLIFGDMSRLHIFLGGHEKKYSPIMTKGPSKTHWWLEKVETGIVQSDKVHGKHIAFKEKPIPPSCRELQYLMRKTCMLDEALKPLATRACLY